jgi:phage terminase large subunit-like protein
VKAAEVWAIKNPPERVYSEGAAGSGIQCVISFSNVVELDSPLQPFPL